MEKPLVSYTAHLSEQDHLNSAGVPLGQATAVLVQDRAYKHTSLVFSVDDHAGDTDDGVYKTAADRKKLSEALKNVEWGPGAEEAIVKRTATVQVNVYLNRVQVTLVDAGQPLTAKPDLKNAAFPIHAGKAPIKFTNGMAEQGNATVHLLEPIRYVDLCASYAGPEILAALSYEGSMEGIEESNEWGSLMLVLGQRNGALEVVEAQRLDSDHDQAHEVRPSKDGIKVRGTAFNPEDASCCPSNSHTTTYRIADAAGCKFAKANRVLKPMPKSDEKVDLDKAGQDFFGE